MMTPLPPTPGVLLVTATLLGLALHPLKPLLGTRPNRILYLEIIRLSDGQDLWLTHDDRSALTHDTFSRGTSRSNLDRVIHSHSSVTTGSILVSPAPAALMADQCYAGLAAHPLKTRITSLCTQATPFFRISETSIRGCSSIISDTDRFLRDSPLPASLSPRRHSPFPR